MSDQDHSPVDALSALQQDLANQDTSFPVLEPGVVDCVIKDMQIVPSKNKPGQSNILIKLVTAMPYKSRTGETKAAGFPLTTYVGLTASENYNPLQRLAQIKEAVFGDKAGAFGLPELYIGKPVTVRIKIEANADRGDSNAVAAFVRKNPAV